MPQLAPLLGEGSFDAGREEERFRMLLRSDVALSQQLEATWRGLRAEVGEAEGMLRISAHGAGSESSCVQ
eukprot:10085834-Karenia_brevis.AAC.1